VLQSHFLDDYKTAYKKAQELDDLPNERQLEDRIYDYMGRYRDVKNDPSVTVHRLIVAENPDAIDCNKIGMYWSFERSGVGSYGMKRQRTERDEDFILTGQVSPRCIDWEHGFASYLWYGDEQWESALFKGCPVLVTHIDDEKLKTPWMCHV
jgi:hypothetical protein